jgi:hypothetical protein
VRHDSSDDTGLSRTCIRAVTEEELEGVYALFQNSICAVEGGLTIDQTGFEHVFEKVFYWWKHRTDLMELSFKVTAPSCVQSTIIAHLLSCFLVCVRNSCSTGKEKASSPLPNSWRGYRPCARGLSSSSFDVTHPRPPLLLSICAESVLLHQFALTCTI